jgi:enamine deaminase RidA (YjgF/YER057c/UK114 family)
MGAEERLVELGIVLPPPATVLGMYKPAVRVGRFIYVSGQLPTRDGAIVNPGRLGDSVSIEQAAEAAAVAATNAIAAARGLLGSIDGLQVVRTVGYVACAPDFEQHPAVVNGGSAVLRDVFGEDLGVGVRLALGVASLPLGAAVEIEVLFQMKDDE